MVCRNIQIIFIFPAIRTPDMTLSESLLSRRRDAETMKISSMLSKPLKLFSPYASGSVEYVKKKVMHAEKRRGIKGVRLILNLPVMISRGTASAMSHTYML